MDLKAEPSRQSLGCTFKDLYVITERLEKPTGCFHVMVTKCAALGTIAGPTTGLSFLMGHGLLSESTSLKESSPPWGSGTQFVLQHNLLWAWWKGGELSSSQFSGAQGTFMFWLVLSKHAPLYQGLGCFEGSRYRLSDCLVEATHSLMLAGTHLINLCQLDMKKKFRFVFTSLITCEVYLKKYPFYLFLNGVSNHENDFKCHPISV